MRSKAMIAAIGVGLLANACSGSGDAGAGNASAGSTAAAGAGGMPANFKATDACSIIDKATIGQVLGSAVTDMSLGLVHEPTGGGDAATSECSYILADGRASIMARWSPIADTSDGTINEARNATKQTVAAFDGGAVEDVAGVGRASLWVEKIGQLQTFIGNDRMLQITVPSGAGAKDKAIALAKKAGA